MLQEEKQGVLPRHTTHSHCRWEYKHHSRLLLNKISRILNLMILTILTRPIKEADVFIIGRLFG